MVRKIFLLLALPIFLFLMLVSSRNVLADIDENVGIVLGPNPPILNPGQQLSVSITGLPNKELTYFLGLNNTVSTITSLRIDTTSDSCSVGAVFNPTMWASFACDDSSAPFYATAFLDTSKIGFDPSAGDTTYMLELSESGTPITLEFTVKAPPTPTPTTNLNPGSCEAGAVFGSSKPVITKDACTKPGFKAYASGATTGPKFGGVDYLCECVPDSASVTPSQLLCSMEFKPCTTNEQCTAGGSGCEQHKCLDIDPQVLSLPLFGGTGGDTKRCLAPDSPYGKQYSKAHEPTPIKNKLIDCKGDLECEKCLKGDDLKGDPNNPQGIPTALGCLKTNLASLTGNIFGILLGLAGGVALILIIYSGYRMVVSAGNPEALQGARETLTAAIVGLLFIIFAFVILQIIGFDILQIPQFKR